MMLKLIGSFFKYAEEFGFELWRLLIIIVKKFMDFFVE